ncbi:MAG: MBL fold metallo-hydrolase [Clostridia bacterium]|nr:MBL fold metallo-hydrolase [Clostridia bacterium]
MIIKRLPLGDVEANCYILCDEETKVGAVVDAGGFSDELLSSIKEAGIEDLKYILCTHGHFDHIAGVKRLKSVFNNAKIVIGKEDAILTEDADKNAAMYFGAPFESFKADILVEEGDVLTIGSKELKVMETPGHSKGGVCYICEAEKFLFSGDTLFKLTVGRTDLWGGSINELLNSIEKLMLLTDDYEVFTGHNISTTIGNERVRNRYLRKKRV